MSLGTRANLSEFYRDEFYEMFSFFSIASSSALVSCLKVDMKSGSNARGVCNEI